MLLENFVLAWTYDLPEGDPDGGPENGPEDGAATGVALAAGSALLTQFGERPPPLGDWADAARYLEALLHGRQALTEDSDTLERMAQAAEELAERAPLAAFLPAAALVAHWEGRADDGLFTTYQGALDWGWHGLVLRLARVLTAADLLWAGLDLVGQALGVVRRAEARQSLPWHISEAIAELRDLQQELQRRYQVHRDELAWALAASCRPADAPLRAPVAALWWTLGEPWYAHALADGTLTPTPRQVRGLLDAALRRSPADPMLSSTASWLWRTPGLDPRAHTPLRRRMESWAHGGGAGHQLEALQAVLQVSPSAAYGRALVSWFAGRLIPEERATIASLVDLVEQAAPPAAIRFRALELLTRPEATQAHWRWLAGRATQIVAAESWYGVSDPYDRSLDLPLYYLEGDLEEHLVAVEGQRRAALEFVLWNLQPPQPAWPDAWELYQEEDDLLKEVRWLRLVMQLPRLPVWARQSWQRIGSGEELMRTSWTDPTRAENALREHRDHLRDLAVRLEQAVPQYGQVRRDPPGTLADFAAALSLPLGFLGGRVLDV